MSQYLVKYYLQDGTENQIKVTAYNVFHAEKLAKEKLGKVHVTSVSSISSEKKEGV